MSHKQNTQESSVQTEETVEVTVEALVEAYGRADRAEKARLRTAWKKASDAAVMAGDLDLAQRYIMAGVTASAASTPKPTVDYAQTVSDRIATLRAAADRMESGMVDLPDGAEVDFENLPEASAVEIAEVERLSVIRTRSGKRNSIPEYVEERLTELGEGWHKVSVIRGDSGISAGAISAHLTGVRDGAKEHAAIEVGTDASGKLAARLA